MSLQNKNIGNCPTKSYLFILYTICICNIPNVKIKSRCAKKYGELSPATVFMKPGIYVYIYINVSEADFLLEMMMMMAPMALESWGKLEVGEANFSHIICWVYFRCGPPGPRMPVTTRMTFHF